MAGFSLILAAWLLMASALHGAQNWPSFRGPVASGVMEGHPTAVRWDVDTSTNIRWKTPIPGLAHSGPVIWDNQIFVTTAETEGGKEDLKIGLYGDIDSVQDDAVYSWKVLCIVVASGRILWEKTAAVGKPKVKRHPKSSHANASPATDGKYVVAFFASEGLYCYDMDGTLLWDKDLGILDSGYFAVPNAQWGSASSPVIHDDKVILQCDVQQEPFLVAYDIQTGKEIWKTQRTELPTWSTPTVLTGTHPQIIVNGHKHIGGYDLETGKEIWNMAGGGDIPVPTPIVAHDLIFITSAHGGMSPVYAIRPSAKGDISLEPDELSSDHIPWWVKRGGNYMTTPLVYGDYLYCCKDNGQLTCFNAKTGETIYGKRLKKGASFSASPVAADGKIYFPDEAGDIHVVKAGPEFNVLAVNQMNETCMATPAISQGTLYLRTRGHLIAIQE